MKSAKGSISTLCNHAAAFFGCGSTRRIGSGDSSTVSTPTAIEPAMTRYAVFQAPFW